MIANLNNSLPFPPRILSPELGYDWREFDRWLQIVYRMLGTIKERNLFVIPGRDGLDGEDGYTYPPIQGPIGPRGESGPKGFDGLDGEDGYSYPPIKGDNGADGRMGVPGQDGEDAYSEDFMFPPGIDIEVLAKYTSRYRYRGPLADTATVTLPTITANYPAHGFIHCAHASTGVISESAEFEYGSTGAVQIIRGTANIEVNAATAGKISLGAAVSANPVVIKNNLGGGVSVNAMIILSYG